MTSEPPKITRWTFYYPRVIYGLARRVNTGSARHRLERNRHGHAAALRSVNLASIREPAARPRRKTRSRVARRRGAVPRTGLPPRHAHRGRRTAEYHQARALQLF